MMARRIIGGAAVTIRYFDSGDYRGQISANGHVWRFADLHAPAVGFGPGIAYDSPAAYDEMARSAVSFGSYYTSWNRGDDTPDWAPSPETADAIAEATEYALDNDGTYRIGAS